MICSVRRSRSTRLKKPSVPLSLHSPSSILSLFVITMSALPDSALILVSGANGYFGSHIVDVLLALNVSKGKKYRVRGTVRENKPWLNQYFENKYGPGMFETVVVPDIRVDGAFDTALNGVDGVIHVAGEMSMAADPEGVIGGTKKATVNIMSAAAAHNVKRFVLTSSSTAVDLPSTAITGNAKRGRIDKNSWNDAAVTAAWSDDTPAAARGWLTYSAAKTEGERTAWQWFRENKPSFGLNAVLPNCLWGRVLSPAYQGSTMSLIRDFWKGNYSGMQILQPAYFINVDDAARLHVAALLDGSIKEERIFAYADQFCWTEVLGILHKLRPGLALPDAPKCETLDCSDIVEQPRAEAILKSFFGQATWTSLEQTIAEGIEDLA
ncbi:aldehyde reductase ii [Ophiostoma piceae UAMH 11346]|uniref:Aldehyde reductase ii n=1 Tax=Ophiostoma piceae (strain UAMH 11346) TaxID=1262450 RepID=S3BTC1_OPHP1|nr:aldehyde reductase ii [Ophiostoma piceae UAMH 11346]